MADSASTHDATEGARAAWADGRAAEAAALFDRAIAGARSRGDLEGWTAAVLALAATQRFGPDPGRIPALLAEALEAGPAPADRARVSAALARSWVYAGAAKRAVRFADAALDLARSSGDPGLLADALDAALTSHWGPDELDRRRELAAELDEVTAHLLDPDARLRAHLWGFTVAFEQLDVLALNRQVRSLELLGEESAKARFFAASRRLALDLMRGRVDTASTLLAIATQAAGEVTVPDAPIVLLALRAYVSLHAGDEAGCAEAAAAAEELADAEGLTTVAAEAAPLWLAAGRPERARALLLRFDGAGLSSVPQDVDWLLVMQCLLDSAVRLGEADVAERLVALVSPFTGRAVVNAGGLMFHGLTDDTLSRAYLLLGDSAAAGRLRASALDRYQRAGAHWWSRRLEAEPGFGPLADPSTASPQQSVQRRVVLRPAAGGGWELGDPDRPVHLAERRGLEHVRRLVSRPWSWIAAIDLVGASSGGAVVESGLGPAVDTTAARAYRARLQELDAELTEAQAWSDVGRVAQLTSERDALLAELAAAFGLGGRPRDAHSSAERARVAVRKAVAAALDQVAQADPVIAAHLRTHLRTGRSCAYQPEPGQEWIWIVT